MCLVAVAVRQRTRFFPTLANADLLRFEPREGDGMKQCENHNLQHVY
jgi:hypothetical protein